jgi:Tfp pilus assembly protein PilF
LKQNRETATFVTHTALELARKGDVDQAIHRLRSAIKTAPDYAPAHYHLSLLLRKTGRTTESEAALKRALELDPQVESASLRPVVR